MPLVTLIASVLLAGATTPQGAVQRFIQPRSPADACAQLAPTYRKTIELQYGPCLAGMKVQPRATRLVISQVHVVGAKATLVAAYTANATRFRERYSLVRAHRVWLVAGSKQL